MFSERPSSSFDSEVESYYELVDPKYKTVDEVRITPGRMIFEDAFDGKQFVRKLVIQNCGANSAFIRICPASSQVPKTNNLKE